MEIMPFIIAICGIAMPVGILAIIFSYANRSEERFHQTVQKLVDNGQELNEDVLSGIPGYRNGINTIGVGVGLSLLGLVGLGDVILGVGMLVTCIGVAILANGYLNRSKVD